LVRDHADRSPQPNGFSRRLAEAPNVTARRLCQTGKTPQQGRLTGAVGSHHSHELARLNAQVNSVQNQAANSLETQPPDFDGARTRGV
jgi:hypothetical protein